MSKRSTQSLNQELAQLRKSGVVLPKNPQRAMETARQMQQMASTPGSLRGDALELFDKFGRSGADVNPQIANINANNAALMSAMGTQRRISGMRRTGSTNDVAIAIPRFYDPLEYWDLSGLPWNMADEGHRHKLHKWLRLYYATHHLIPILIDIFTRFPLVGMHMYCKDKKITEFYEDLFLNELKYEEFLTNMGREYWTVGEAFPLGSFNEDLGVWEREELLNPEDIVIENFPLLGTQQIKVVPPEYMKRLATTKSPPEMYKQLEINFPDLIPYLKRGEPFPVSDVLLKQVAFKITDWDDHGTPILLRGLRTLLHEEKLLASQDAIAERLYSPLILAKLGVNNMGDGEGPWIPGADQLQSFRDDMDLALSSDFRLMVYHYALEVENVFGREQVPDLWNDFDRINTWLLQIFGLQGVLGSGTSAQPYATSALNAEFMNQILRTFQKYMKDHARGRMEVVAEAQGHYEYEKRGQTRVPVMEEIAQYDAEGNLHIIERHKLLVPDLEMETLDLRDEATERQFLQSLRSMGVPISDERLMVGINFEFKDSLDEMQEEMIQKTVAQQMAKLQTYKILRSQGLSIPPDLRGEIEGGGPAGAPGGAPGGPPGMGGGSVDVGAPAPGGGGGMIMPPPPPGLGPNGVGGPVPGGGPPPAGPVTPGSASGTVPDVSNERRPGMPTAAVHAFLRTAGADMTDEVLSGLDAMSDEQIDTVLHEAQTQINEIEWRKKMRQSPRERRANRVFQSDNQEDLKMSDEKIVIDRVPPKVRKDIIAGG
jgi:hypothetical protein